MKKYFIIAVALAVLFSVNLYANNIQIDTQPQIVDLDTTLGTCNIQFDMSWDNSWRLDVGPSNYDGAWVFVKYQVNTGDWNHAILSSVADDHSITNNNGVPATIQPVSTGLGCFFHRSENGDGSNNWDGVKLNWNFSAANISPNSIITVQVFAIEMVYVPEGAFHLGSGGEEVSHFYTYPTTTSTYQINSEDAINVGTTDGYLYYPSSSYGGDNNGPIPAEFPKGYSAFWMMKYEITQEQYSDFLNTLTAAQKSSRFPNHYDNYRHYIKLVDGVYGCDGNNNNILNETDDGQNIGCNYLSWADGVAYADWSGMRPMTELEFEKACRGTVAPVPNEYAWGNTTIVQATGITNQRTATEVTTPENANCVYGGLLVHVRVGNFARTGSTRQSSGSSYYGIMDLSGNLSERPVTVGNAYGRVFTGVLGDGTLDASGNANVTNWPEIYSYGSGFRGGNWLEYSNHLPVSGRIWAAISNYSRERSFGFRCCIGSVAP